MCKLTRRQFLKTTLGAVGGLACCSAAWGRMGSNYVYAANPGGSDCTAVFLNQFGGNDGLNSFAIPYIRSSYYDRRPTLAIPEPQVLVMSSGIGLHPVMTNLHNLYLDGDVAVIQGIGDPLGTRSHFTAQEIFSKGMAQNSAIENRGWIGRMGDLYMTDVQFNTFGLGVGNQTDFNCSRTTNRPLVTNSLSSVGFDTDNGMGYTERMDDLAFKLITQKTFLDEEKSMNGRGESIRLAQKSMHDSVDAIGNVVSGYTGSFGYQNNSVGWYFNDVARLAEAGIGTQITYGGIGGWDTHSDQGATNSQLSRLAEIDDGIGKLAQDLKRAEVNKWNETVICIFTEFGRNTFENASAGTDHGWGGTMVVIGGAVNGGVYGSTPSESEISNDPWIYMDIDFRNVFSEIITWMGYNPDPVFPESFSKVNLNII